MPPVTPRRTRATEDCAFPGLPANRRRLELRVGESRAEPPSRRSRRRHGRQRGHDALGRLGFEPHPGRRSGSVSPGSAGRREEHDMTERKSLKRRVRSRMEKTGERYTAARRHVLDEPEPAVDRPRSAWSRTRRSPRGPGGRGPSGSPCSTSGARSGADARRDRPVREPRSTGSRAGGRRP